jgi:predicted small lipoprotein YifL
MPTTLRKAVDLIQRMLSRESLTTRCILLCIGWTLAGCGQATGPYFRPAEHLTPDQTMVYLYFPKQSGYSDSYTILGNGTTVTRLDEGGYYPFCTVPGRMTFSLDGYPEKQTLTIAAQPGHTYFVKVVLVERRALIRGENRFYQLFPVRDDLAYAEMSPLRLMATCYTTEGCAQKLN